eukprot:CAMPEP_0196748790 /NCGR_PEP_ID=MMETSP1091-20130531/74550_1 /TAXON_ID=302021 /ORGANISM="Rhodomonas sp., Strain CCMP768" /LENGTH=81 /DNA_ID=CAMNT_0042096153 /DNA_START=76 /DNA_END=317 /DNA_ORIENTATION=-
MRVASLLLILLSFSHASAGLVSGNQCRLRGGEGAGRPEREKVCLVGSGNWGCAIARIVGANVVKPHAEKCAVFDHEVKMWV